VEELQGLLEQIRSGEFVPDAPRGFRRPVSADVAAIPLVDSFAEFMGLSLDEFISRAQDAGSLPKEREIGSSQSSHVPAMDLVVDEGLVAASSSCMHSVEGASAREEVCSGEVASMPSQPLSADIAEIRVVYDGASVDETHVSDEDEPLSSHPSSPSAQDSDEDSFVALSAEQVPIAVVDPDEDSVMASASEAMHVSINSAPVDHESANASMIFRHKHRRTLHYGHVFVEGSLACGRELSDAFDDVSLESRPLGPKCMRCFGR
jgi:hypothetical protein